MKYVAFLLNIVLLAFALLIMFNQLYYAVYEWQSPETPLLFLGVIVPVFNIYYLITSHLLTSKSWLGLYLSRKKLEEKAKIEKLNAKD